MKGISLAERKIAETEATLLKQLVHENVLAYVDCFVNPLNDIFYLVTEVSIMFHFNIRIYQQKY